MSWKLAFGLVLSLTRSFTEGLGLLLLLPALQLAGVPMGNDTAGRVATVVKSGFLALGLKPVPLVVLTIFALVICVFSMLTRWQSTAAVEIHQNFIALLRRRLYQSVANANWLFFSRCRQADFAHALTTEMDRVATATAFFLQMVPDAIITSIYVLFALKISLLATSSVLLSGALVTMTLKNRTRAMRASGENLSAATNAFHVATLEHLGAMKIAKSYGAEKSMVDLFNALTDRVSEVSLNTIRGHSSSRAWFDMASAMILCAVLYICIVTKTSTAALLLLVFLFARLMPKLTALQQSYQYFINALPAFATVSRLQKRCDAAREIRVANPERVQPRSAIKLDRVSFSYVADTPVIIDLSLEIPVGQTTAIVGPSGAGKSTIADLVTGLIVPDHGSVLLDDRALTPNLMASWRDQLGYVAQDTFLFHDTVRANLLWARPAASDQELAASLQLASAGEFVSSLPQGIETIVGDRGVLLSGGQRQRIALARALLRKPSLLILDEATNSVDSENELRIQAAIEELHGDMTILLITHRLATVKNADLIYVVENGAVVESGTWNSLTNRSEGRFYALSRAQAVNGGQD
jgi:ATP-binding cassette subfamily C protein